MGKCTKKNCPMQYNTIDENCDIKDCRWRTEPTLREEFFNALIEFMQTEKPALIEQTRKETAKEIIENFLLFKNLERNDVCLEMSYLKILAKKYGVEIEE